MAVTRRVFVSGLAGGLTSAKPLSALAATRRRPPRVAVIGGGIAGLTAAHELADRGFAVTVFERRAWGGKARSTSVPGSGLGGRAPLPGEHGYRVFFGFYEHLPDTFARIPFATNPNGVLDNLTGCSSALVARDRGRRDLLLPIEGLDDRQVATREQVVDALLGFGTEAHLPPAALARFVRKMVVWLSSCDARRLGQWENTSWTDFTGADRYGEDFRRILINPLSEVVQASKAEDTAAAFSAHVVELAILYAGLLRRGRRGPGWGVLVAPTDEALIGPWLAELRRLGVRLHLGEEVRRVAVDGGRAVGVLTRSSRGTHRRPFDHVVCALPVERAGGVVGREVLAADERLRRAVSGLQTSWFNGIQFFLREDRPVVRGHVFCADAPWLVSGISQGQLWDRDFSRRYGDGQVRGCFSAGVSNWFAPGRLTTNKPAHRCTPEEVSREVWAELKAHLADRGDAVLHDELLHSWTLDPGLRRGPAGFVNEDPLVLPSVGSRALRPPVTTTTHGLVLAGDWLDGDWECANMESACHSAKVAVNAILDSVGSNAEPCRVVPSYRPPEWRPLKVQDERRWARGEANLFDRDLPVERVRSLAGGQRRGEGDEPHRG